MSRSGWLSWMNLRSRSPHRTRSRRGKPLGGIQDWMLEERCLLSGLVGDITDPQVPQGSNTALNQIFWNGGIPLNPDGVSGINASPTVKTITLTNTTDQTIYPILRDANTGQDPKNTNPNNPGNYYDPQDFHNQEYRAYIGYVQNGIQYLGLPAGATIAIQVPLVFWDAENTYIGTDGKDLIPANPATDSNPFQYDASSLRGVSLSTDTNSWVTKFTAPSGEASAGLVMFYHATIPHTPALDAPAQLTEFTIRDPYLNTGGSGSLDKGWLTDTAQTKVLFNYDVSYVDNLTSSIAMEATQVPIPIADDPAPPAEDYGWVGSSLIYGTPTQSGTMQNLVNDFINNTGPASIGSYFGKDGWPSYFNPDGTLKIPGGANIFANSPLNGQLSSYLTDGVANEFMLSSGGTGPIAVRPGGMSLTDPHQTELPLTLTSDQRAAFVQNIQEMLANDQEVDFSISPDPTVLGTVTAYDPRAEITSFVVTDGGSGYTSAPTVTISGGGGSGAQAIAFLSGTGTIQSIGIIDAGSDYTSPPTVTITGGGGSGATAVATIGGGTATVKLNPGVNLPTNTPVSYVFSRPATDYAATDLMNLWYSWAQYYVNQFADFQPPSGATGSIAANTNILTLSGSVPSTLAVGMTVSGSGIVPAEGTSATILNITSDGVQSISVTNGGSGYDPKNPPTVNITGGGGSGATATAIVSAAGVITGVTITNGGRGYTSAPTISFSGGGGSGATATATVGKVIYVSQLSKDGGAGTYTFAAPQALPFTNTDGIKSILVTNGGSGYNPDAPPTVTISGGGGSGASAVAIVSKTGEITGIALINAGSGYTSPPTIAFTGGGGSGATATATVGTFVQTFDMTFPQDQQQTARAFAGSVYEAMAAEAAILNYTTRSPLLPPPMSLVYTVIGCDTLDLPNSNGGGSLVGAQVRDLIKSILRGVPDFTDPQYADSKQWYPDPSKGEGDKSFNVFNLDPYVWFVHNVLGLSGYGFSVDDDTADVDASASPYTPMDQQVYPNNLQFVFSGLGNLNNPKEWFLSVHYGTVIDNHATISNPTDGPYAGKTIVTLSDPNLYWKIAPPDPTAGQIGAYVSGDPSLGIPDGTLVEAQGDVKSLILILNKHVADASNVTLAFTGKPVSSLSNSPPPPSSPPPSSTPPPNSASSPLQELFLLAQEEFLLTVEQVMRLVGIAYGIAPPPTLETSIAGLTNAISANPESHTLLGQAVINYTFVETIELLTELSEGT